jgi:hypothetical protein
MNFSYKPPDELQGMENGVFGAFLFGLPLPDFVIPDIFYNSRNRIMFRGNSRQ